MLTGSPRRGIPPAGDRDPARPRDRTAPAGADLRGDLRRAGGGAAAVLRIDRTGAAIIGAILMVTVGGLSLEEAYRAVDYRTLVLLFGMMVLITHLQLARFFSTLARVTVA